jgi:hypothetical protein
MDLFKWVGRKKREEEWMRQPRRVPDFAARLPEDTDRWYVTQEFVNDEDKNLRCYLAVYQPTPGVDNWRIFHVEYNLKNDEGYVTANWTSESNDPMDVVTELRGYERKMKNSAAYISHEYERSTYRAFANKYGIHFDDDGNVFRVKTEAPLAKGTFMNRESLDKLFRKEAAKDAPLDTWEGIYKGIVEARSSRWTITESAFGLPEDAATPSGTPYDSSALKPVEKAIPAVSSIAEIIESGSNVFVWKGSAATIPTAQEIQEAKLAAEKKALESTTPVGAETTTDKTSPVAPTQPVTIDGKSLEQLAAEKAYAQYPLLQKLERTRPLTMDDLAADPAYAEYGSIMKQMMVRLNELPKAMNGKAANRYEKEALLKGLVRFSFETDLDDNKQALAEHECNATILVGLVRAGQAVYADQFGPGKKFTPEGLNLISAIGTTASRFAIDRLGVDAEEAKKIADVISKGPDPFGTQLPLEKTFEKLPPPAVKAKRAPRKKAPSLNRGDY